MEELRTLGQIVGRNIDEALLSLRNELRRMRGDIVIADHPVVSEDDSVDYVERYSIAPRRKKNEH